MSAVYFFQRAKPTLPDTWNNVGALSFAISDFNVCSYVPEAAVCTVVSIPVSFLYSSANAFHWSEASGFRFR